MLCPHTMGLKRRAAAPTLSRPHRLNPAAQRVRCSDNIGRLGRWDRTARKQMGSSNRGLKRKLFLR
jgi:hypothetical protein